MKIYVIKKEASISYERPYYFDYCDSSFAVDIAIPQEKKTITNDDIVFVDEFPSDLKGYTTKNSFKYKLYNNDLGELVKDINEFGWAWKECSSSFSAIIFNSTYKRKKDN